MFVKPETLTPKIGGRNQTGPTGLSGLCAHRGELDSWSVTCAPPPAPPRPAPAEVRTSQENAG